MYTVLVLQCFKRQFFWWCNSHIHITFIMYKSMAYFRPHRLLPCAFSTQMRIVSMRQVRQDEHERHRNKARQESRQKESEVVSLKFIPLCQVVSRLVINRLCWILGHSIA